MDDSIITLKNKIYTIRNIQVMLDSDLAALYEVETKVFNQAVKRNIERFPESFMFQLSEDEYNSLRSQIVTLKTDGNLRSQSVTSSQTHGGRRYLPFVCTEHGVAMLSGVLKSSIAIEISVQIINQFIEMRKFINDNALLFSKINAIERKQIETDSRIDHILSEIERRDIQPKQGIFFDGQVYDAYTFVIDLIRKATKSIYIIDNYLDDTALTMLSKNEKKIRIKLYTKNISKQFELDIKKYREQYGNIEVIEFSESHDRFIIIDEEEIYHFGASLKDLGKKWFAFSKMDKESFKIMERLG